MHRAMANAGVILLAAFVTLQGALAVDLVVRIWMGRAGFESAVDVALLITLEAIRALVTFTVAGLALGSLRRQDAGHAALSAALLFGAVAYANASSFVVFPGHFQEWLARFLLGRGTPPGLLRVLFASAAWALPPAAATFAFFAARFPVPATPDAVRAVSRLGRRGMLRDVALAGMDVRSVVHRAAAVVLELRLLEALPLTVFAIAGTALAVTGRSAGVAIAVGSAAAVFALATAILRTAFLTHDGAHRARLRRLAAAGAAMCIQFVGSGALSFIPGRAAAMLALGFAAAAPLLTLFFLIGFMRAAPRQAANPLIPGFAQSRAVGIVNGRSV